MLKQHSGAIVITTRGPGLTDITQETVKFVSRAEISEGLLTLFLRHTSASLLIQENADTDVLRDLENFFSRLVSRDLNLYHHKTEGPDDMPAHIRSALTQTSLSIPVKDGALALGIWQAIYLFEHRAAPHKREIVMQIIGQ
jgi:secondary thiamine-phosphate synthase enzyme